MQEPFPAPDETFPEAPDSPDDFAVVNPRPAPTPDQIAERSALEVFPGAELAAETDEWWLEGDDEQPADAPPFEDAPEPQAVPSEPLEPAQLFPSAQVIEVEAEAPVAEPPPVVSEAAPQPAPPAQLEPADTAVAQPREAPPTPPVEPTSVPQAPVQPAPVLQTPVEQAPPAATPAAPSDDNEFSRRALSMPLYGGRERREAAGASQRAAILAQAGAVVDPEDDEDAVAPIAPVARAAADQSRPGAPAAPAPAAGGRTLTRKIALSVFVSALALVVLSGGAVVSGQGAEIERVASALAPDPVERWISERVSSFGTSSVAPEASPPAIDVPAGGDAPLFGRIAHSGGAGVAVRTTCVPEARATRTIAEGTRVTVIARGVGDCSGWNVVRAGATVSWIEASYIEPLPRP